IPVEVLNTDPSIPIRHTPAAPTHPSERCRNPATRARQRGQIAYNIHMMNPIRGRWPFLLILVACAGLLAYAYYAQFVLELEPCPLCILQRLGFMLMGVFALAGAVHGPVAWGRWIYGVPILLGAGWG